ncbi:DUF4424 domain-containing protein [Streptomyces cyaneus]|uniref:DUF4424 domain-containing protein n=1 Tax=Streptomyces cyaneus TaxID=1904 RepID=UPI001FEB3697|nr:DUF4424 domain-containing protein [Streptomyces cyaneus]
MGLNREPAARTVASGASEQPREIRVEIGELSLQGFRVDPERVSAAFEQELSRLVRAHGVPLAADGALTLDALKGLPPLPAGLSARRLGQELARVVHEGLSGHGEVTR